MTSTTLSAAAAAAVVVIRRRSMFSRFSTPRAVATSVSAAATSGRRRLEEMRIGVMNFDFDFGRGFHARRRRRHLRTSSSSSPSIGGMRGDGGRTGGTAGRRRTGGRSRRSRPSDAGVDTGAAAGAISAASSSCRGGCSSGSVVVVSGRGLDDHFRFYDDLVGGIMRGRGRVLRGLFRDGGEGNLRWYARGIFSRA